MSLVKLRLRAIRKKIMVNLFTRRSMRRKEFKEMLVEMNIWDKVGRGMKLKD